MHPTRLRPTSTLRSMGCDNTLRARCLRLFSHSAGLATTPRGGACLTLLKTPAKIKRKTGEKKRAHGKAPTVRADATRLCGRGRADSESPLLRARSLRPRDADKQAADSGRWGWCQLAGPGRALVLPLPPDGTEKDAAALADTPREECAARRHAHGQSDAEGVLLHTVKWLWMRAPGTTRRRKTMRSSPSAKLEHHVIAWRDSRHAAPSSVHRRKARGEYGAGIERHGEAAETRGAGSHGGRRTSVCSHGCNEDAGTDCAATDARMHTQIHNRGRAEQGSTHRNDTLLCI